METQNTSSRRLKIVVILLVLGGVLIGLRMFQKQVIEHPKYKALAQGQYSVKQNIPAKRGNIYAADKFPLATDMTTYQILAVPRNIKDKKTVAGKISELLSQNQEEIFQKINNNKAYIPPLAKKVEKNLADKIEKENIEGIVIIPESSRIYPEKNFASHVLGFVNSDGQGNYGLEGYWNAELQGSSGQVTAERDTQGRFFNIGKQTEPKDGSDIYLTINHDIQYQAEQELEKAIEEYKATGGSIIILDPKTNQILAMAARPDFDPNEYNKVSKDNQKVFVNPAVSSTWEPGSVFKPVTMSAAIDLGRVEPDTKGTFSNMVKVQNYEIHTAQDKAFGEETMTQVLENSDNVAMVWVTAKMKFEELRKYITDYGFGAKTGIQMDGEAEGRILSMRDWRDVSQATMAFGQGISMSPLQMATAIAAIANKGKLMKPYLVEKVVSPDGKEEKFGPKEVRQVIKPEVADKITGMMVSVVEKGHGKKAAVSGIKVAGKTGTAQIPAPNGGYLENAHIGSFAGFFPANDPKIAMLVKLDRPQNVEWAESSAAPTFGKMANWLVDYLQIPKQ